MSGPLRSDDLQIAAITRLEATLDIPADNIIPVAIAAKRDDLDPRVSVGASLDSAGRDNNLEATTGRIRVVVDGTGEYVATEGTLGLSQLQSAVADELLTIRDGFQPTLQTEDEIAWSDTVNRYLGVSEFTVERTTLADPQP